MRYLLDTNIVSDLVRRPQGTVAARIAEVGEGEICTSIIVASELRYGSMKRDLSELSERVEAALKRFDVLDYKPPADAAYGRIRARLERSRMMIGANDLFIAAHALALGLTLVTDNDREFARVDGLPLVNWLRPE
ncbi:MAG: type II toxin-antitoxin system VapC family toxin [Alphaproteobacteria bacterium]|nr:type II toxin-antitoxin system VapC family toxin [Alphaproteobacteria bacterium]